MLKIFKSTSNSLCIMLKCKLKYGGGGAVLSRLVGFLSVLHKKAFKKIKRF